MNRKDTIMVAVLLNAGLLIALFATTLKSGSQEPSIKPSFIEESLTHTYPEEKKQEAEIHSVASLSSISNPSCANLDEVEQVIRKYATPTVAANTVEITPNFATDLQAIGQTEEIQEQKGVPAHESIASLYQEIKVKKGDVLEKIAKSHSLTVAEIIKANQLTSTRLKIGQVLKIPKAGQKSAAQANKETSKEDAIKYYTIKNGDNPWTIAVKNHLKVEELLKLNNLNEEKARHLKPGDQIRIQ